MDPCPRPLQFGDGEGYFLGGGKGYGREQRGVRGCDLGDVGSVITEAEDKKGQLESDIKLHRADRDAAKEAMDAATAFREYEAAAKAAEKYRGAG